MEHSRFYFFSTLIYTHFAGGLLEMRDIRKKLRLSNVANRAQVIVNPQKDLSSRFHLPMKSGPGRKIVSRPWL